MRIAICFFLVIAAVACTPSKVSVPNQFSSQATKLKVRGLNGWMINQRLSFGTFQTSEIRRGWDKGSSFQFTKFGMDPFESVLRIFNVETDKKSLTQKNRFQYTLYNGALATDIFAMEKFTEKQLIYKSNNPWIGSASKTNRYEYAFTAAIVPAAKISKDPWSLVLINKYDSKKDTARGLFDRPYVEEEGYATNGKENIAIRPLRIDKVTTRKGKDTRVAGGSLLSGYEISWDGGVVGIIDILDNSIWLANNLDNEDKMIISSIASAILLKRMQDVNEDKDDL